jgi:hypothetical protein
MKPTDDVVSAFAGVSVSGCISVALFFPFFRSAPLRDLQW